jgi:hypothetical protein
VKVVGVMVVRNAADLLAAVIRHHRRAAGLDEVLIVDNDSTDATPAVLSRLSSADPGVRWRRELGPFRHAEILTGLAREAAERGASWVVPIDADEFWWSRTESLRHVLEATPADIGAWICPVQQFVQRQRVLHNHRAVLLSMTHLAPPRGEADMVEHLVETGEIAFVEMLYPPKVVVRASANLEIHTGSHTVAGFQGIGRPSEDLAVLHAPLPSREALRARAEHGRRVAATRKDLRSGWHARRWARLADEGIIDQEWRANATRGGAIELPGGVRRQLEYDERLRALALPGISWVDRILGPVRSITGQPRWPRRRISP